MLERFISLFESQMFANLLDAAWVSAPFWMPALLISIFVDLWVDYRRRLFIKEKGSVLLEIKIPREMVKSPQSVEAFLSAIHEPVPSGNLLKTYLDGSVRPWFSLELVSIDGAVHFYIWARKDYHSVVETQLYAQFPSIEIHEVPDYSMSVHQDPNKFKFGWFGQLALTKADAFPIKTYVDYALDEDPKEEYKHDPLVPLLEFLGSLKKGEQAWVQILIQANTKEGLAHGRILTKQDWKSGIDDAIKEIIEKARFKPDGDHTPTSLHLSKNQQDTIASIERNMGKWAFDTMIRIGYFAHPDVFNASNTGGLIRSFKSFAGANGLKPNWYIGYKYPEWQDIRGKKKMLNERLLLEAYKRRSFFNPPFRNFHGKPFVLTTEELATLFHFPSMEVAATPTLTRIPSKKAEAPANLPI